MAIGVFVVATVIAIVCPAFAPIYGQALLGVGLSLGVGGLIAGIRSHIQGNGFWDGFVNHISENWEQEVALSMIFALIMLGINKAAAAIKNSVGQKSIKNGSKAIKNLAYDDMLPEEKIAYNGYEKNGWKGNYPGQIKGTKAGGRYMNTDNKLPLESYREFDVNPPVPGVGRDSSRFVVDSLSNVYLTRDHYKTFFKIIR